MTKLRLCQITCCKVTLIATLSFGFDIQYSRVLNVFGMAVLLILISVVKSMLNFYKYHKTPFKKRIMTTALALLFLHINRTLKVSNWVTQEKTWC